MRLCAAAKINLHLRVGPLDHSGFHPLMSWMCTVALFDTLTIEPANSLILTCDDPHLPCDAKNLVMKSALAMQPLATPAPERSAGPDAHGLKMHLQKRIPSGGGLGGGSSDAARTLLGINQLWNLRRPIAHLSRIAANLGSDVPFFLQGASSICAGRGEIIIPIPPPKPRYAILFLSDFPMPTADVYRRFDQMHLGNRAAIEQQPPWTQWADLSAGPLLQCLVNDLEPPAMAISPQLKTLREDLEKIFQRPVRMSGSGSSLFTLFDDLDEAHEMTKRIKNRRDVRAVVTEIAPKIDDDIE